MEIAPNVEVQTSNRKITSRKLLPLAVVDEICLEFTFDRFIANDWVVEEARKRLEEHCTKQSKYSVKKFYWDSIRLHEFDTQLKSWRDTRRIAEGAFDKVTLVISVDIKRNSVTSVSQSVVFFWQFDVVDKDTAEKTDITE